MGEFGWAYISGAAPIQSAGGVSGSVQFASDTGNIDGSSRFVYKNQIDTLELTGTLKVVGDITASNYVIENVSQINSAGSSKFGNSSDDIHQYTGSIYADGTKHLYTGSVYVKGATDVVGPITSSTTITATKFIGNGSELTNLPAATGVTHANYGQYKLVTSVNSTSIQGENNLAWKNNYLFVTGSVYASQALSASALSGYGANLHSLNASNLSAGTLDNARLPSSISVTNLAGAGASITALNASNVSAGTLDNARLPTILNSKLPAQISQTKLTGSTHVSSSAFYGQSATLSRDLTVLGTLTANNLNVTTTGDTIFGDNSADEHQFTGSVYFAGPISASTGLSASVLIGDGALITGLPPYGSPAIATYSNSGQYRLVASVDSDTVKGEPNLSWKNNYLLVTGSIVTSQNISSSNLRVTNNVGIGTTSPDEPLHIVSAGNGGVEIENTTGAPSLTFDMPSNEEARILFKENTELRASIVWDSEPPSPHAMIFKGKGSNTEVMRIDPTGKVGIGTGSPDHMLTVAGALSSSLAVSASAFYGDGSNLSNVGGTLTVKEEGVNLTTEATSINFIGAYVTASNSGDAVTVTVNAGAGGGSTIGAAEDGSYADGLFTDFTTATTVGTAVDKFNEVLKILAPSPAPGLQHIGVSTGDGITAKLSFGASAPVTDITSSGTGAGWSPAIDRNEVYAPATDGYKKRLGIYNNSDITGIINYDIAASITNGNYAYTNDAFGNGETGTLKLELNGALVHSINLASVAGAGAPPNGTDDTEVNGNGSGFVDVSATGNTLDGNGANWGSIFKYRSAEYIIKAVDQKRGWNYLRVIHTVGATNAASNYIEWINDPAANAPALSVSNARIENVNLVGSKYFSGVKYNTDATAKYKVDLNNMYRNVYPNGGTPISFSATNSGNPASVAVDSLGGGDNNTKVIGLTGSLDCSVNTLLDGAISCNMSATHPLKSNLSNTGAATASGFLIDNRTLTSDWNTENFHDETFRKTSGSYATQGSVTHSDATWNSQTHMNGGGAQDDGLLLWNQELRSPKQGANSGNFGGLANGPGGNPNYSSLTDATRTYYRVVSASTGQAYDIRIVTTQGGTTFNNSGLGTGNAHMFVKVPGTTGWMDATQTFAYGAIADGNGALNPTAGNNATTRYLTFGTASVANNEHIMFKIVTDKSWTGNVSAIEFTPNVSNATNAAVLSTIDVDQNGTNVKLSFGASNVLGTHSSVLGSGLGSMSSIDSNGTYTSSGNRKAAFLSKPTVEGDVNGNGAQFRNAFTGSLILEVNGVEKHSVSLETLNAVPNGGGYDANSNGSGFDLTAVAWRQGPASANDYRYPYRTGKYKVHPDDQRIGWNYVRVIHRETGESDVATSYGEWVVDDDVAAMAATNVALTNFGHTDVYYQSGVKYFASRPTGSFSYTMSNAYKNVYHNGSTGITFPTKTNCTVTNTKASGTGVTTLDAAGDSKSLPVLNNSAGCQNQDLHVTGTVLFNNLTSISGAYGSNAFTKYSVSVSGRIKHPFKSDVTTSTASKTTFMNHSGAIGSTNETTEEYFNTEHYRIVTNAYANQASIVNASQAWNSQTAMNGGGTHDDGVVTVGGYMISPLRIGNAGDTRNAADGGSLQAPAGSPNYSSLTANTRTFYRYFKNNSGVLKQNSMSINLYGDAYLVGKSGALNGSLGANKNIHVEIKVSSDPSYTGGDDKSTGWCDAIKAWDNLEDLTVDGAGLLNGVLTQTVPGGGRVIPLEFQTKGIYNNQYFVVKISAHKSWTGYLSRIRMAYS